MGFGVHCVYCSSRSIVGRGWREGLYRLYCCKDCGVWFNDRTVFASSKLSLRVWFFTAFMLQSKVSVRELAKDLGLPHNTMYRVVERLNLYLTASTIKLIGLLSWTRFM